MEDDTLTDEGAKHLSDALKSGNRKLTELDVEDDNLTDEGAKHLSDALKSGNRKLTELDVEDDNDKCKLTKLGGGVTNANLLN
jgi:Ran GTPase-activating protein (RanGAP) involved in mRNA processing and transport